MYSLNLNLRFAAIEEQKDAYRMFTIANPLTRSGKQKGLIQQWGPKDGSLVRTVVVTESLSALAVRDDGRFVGVGTMFSGSVDVYVAFSLQVSCSRFLFSLCEKGRFEKVTMLKVYLTRSR